VLALDVLEHHRDPVAVVVGRELAGPQLVRADQVEGRDLTPEQARRARVEVESDRLDEGSAAVLADQPGRTARRHAADLVVGRRDR
jgi:hypothetical protein